MKKFFKFIKSFIRNDNPEARIKWSLYIRVWTEIGKPQWKWLLLGVICTTLAAAAEGFSITLVKQVIDRGFIEKNMQSLFFIGLQIVTAFGAKGVFSFLKTVTMTKAGLVGATNLRRRLYQHVLRQPMIYFQASRTGTIMNYFTNMSNSVLSLVTTTIITTVHNIATIVMMLGLMIWYAPQMTTVLTFLIPAIVVPLTIITRKRRILSRNTFGAEAASMTQLTQTIAGIKTIQAFCNEQFEQDNMNKIEDESPSVRRIRWTRR